MTNSVDTDQTPRSVASDLGIHCLLRPVFPKTEKIRLFKSVYVLHRRHTLLIYLPFVSTV